MNFWNINNFNREISALKNLKTDSLLHPLRQEQIKLSLMQKLRDEKTPGTQNFISRQKTNRLIKYLASVLSGLALLGGTAFASSGALPGDILFPVKKVKEKIELSLTTGNMSKAQVEARHARERINEILKLQQETDGNKNQADIKFKAQIDAKEEVGHAINALAEVKNSLPTKNNGNAIESIDNNIKQLRDQAVLADISLDNTENFQKQKAEQGLENNDSEKNKENSFAPELKKSNNNRKNNSNKNLDSQNSGQNFRRGREDGRDLNETSNNNQNSAHNNESLTNNTTTQSSIQANEPQTNIEQEKNNNFTADSTTTQTTIIKPAPENSGLQTQVKGTSSPEMEQSSDENHTNSLERK